MKPRHQALRLTLLAALLATGLHSYAQSIDLPKVSRYVEKPTTAHDTVTIHEDGASFIRVCFKSVSAPVKVRSPDKREQYVYSPGKWKRATRRGELTCAMSIDGDTAVVEFLGTGKAEISGYDVGLPQSDVYVPETTCGANDMQWTECVKSTEPAVYERRRPVAKIHMTDRGSACTAWRVGSGNKMLTNNHCVNTPEGVAAVEVQFAYEYPNCDGTGALVPLKLPASELLDTYQPLDYTLFTVQADPALQAFGWFGLDPAPAAIGDRIYMIGHPQAKAKRAIVTSDLNTTGLCQIDRYFSGWGPDSDYGYHCDSEGGQSGSPVLRYGTNRALGLHHFGNVTVNGQCGNGGVRMMHIWPRISAFFDGVPAGDNESPAEGPVVKAQVSCVDNVCQYASAGSVAESFYWYFGDGSSSTDASGVHTYSIPGLYNVVLYATRNGVTDAATVQVQVVVPGYDAPPIAKFIYTVDGLTVQFKSTSYDPEGQPLTYAWRVRDPVEAVYHYYTVAEFTHTYPAPGAEKYADLTVKDPAGNKSPTFFARFALEAPPPPPPPDPCGDGVCKDGETYATCPADCPAPPPPPPAIALSYTAKRVQGPNYDVTFKWSGAAGSTVKLYRKGAATTTANDGTETYRTHKRDNGMSAKVCDTTQCSRTLTVNF